LPLWLPVRRAGRRLRATLSFPPGIATAARRLAIAGAVVLGSQDLATAVVLRLANARGSAGAVVLYNLAWTLFLLPWSVLAVPVATAAFPRLAARWHEGRHADYDATVARTTTAVAVAMVGAAALLVAVAGPAARVLILGAPGTVAPRLLGGALAAFAPGLVGYGIVAMLSRSHYARGDARTPAVATAAGWAVAVGADLAVTAVAPRQWIAAALGGGVAIGMSVAGGLLLLAQRRAAAASLAGAAPAGARALAAGVPAAAAGVLVARLVPAGSVAASIGATAAVAAVTLASYLLLLLVLGGSAQLRALHVVRDG
jgi:putative peptidoglycan lipid II flippase